MPTSLPCANLEGLASNSILPYRIQAKKSFMLSEELKDKKSPTSLGGPCTYAVTGSWNGLAVKPMDRGKFCNRTSIVRIRVVSYCYTDGLVFHMDQ
jgi:hypothetical protein